MNGEFLSTASSGEEKLCNSCDAACCRRNTVMRLTSEEVDSLRSAGTEIELTLFNMFPKLKSLLDIEGVTYADLHAGAVNYFTRIFEDPRLSAEDKMFAQKGIFLLEEQEDGKCSYTLLSDCGYLDELGLCTVFDDSEKRPELCAQFPEGDSACITLRKRGMQIGLAITPKPGVDI
jgi:hypothetical protein